MTSMFTVYKLSWIDRTDVQYMFWIVYYSCSIVGSSSHLLFKNDCQILYHITPLNYSGT